MTSQISLVDLAIQHQQISDEIDSRIATVIKSGDFVLGQAVKEFEDEFARYCQVQHCVGVANGTDAIELMLRATEIRQGDEVIVPALGFVASAAAVMTAGARPVFVDVDPEHLLIDPAGVSAAMGPTTRAVLAVHLYGQMAPLDQLQAAMGPGMELFEDAAQAHGATRWGRPAGSWGTAAATSFYPSKNLGAYGDGGAVLTDDSRLAANVRALRNHGGEHKYEHRMVGGNSRLDTIQAVVLLAKLARLADWNEQRRQAAHRYQQLLSDMPGIQLPLAAAGNEHVWHLFVVRVANRDDVLEHLRSLGIGASIHYPQPLHLLPCFAGLGYRRGSCPQAEQACTEILTLPLFPGITVRQQERVAAAIREACA